MSQADAADANDRRYGAISEHEAELIREAIRRPLYGPQPCRQATGYCYPDGDCYACSASMGVMCRGDARWKS